MILFVGCVQWIGSRAPIDEVPWCILGCGVGHADMFAHDVGCPRMGVWCGRATFCDVRLMSRRE